MTLPQEQYDELLHRAALASLFYYPEIAVEDSDYSLEKDIDYCLEPVMGLEPSDIEALRSVVGRVITNPSAHRAELIELVVELAPEAAGE